MSSAKAEVKSPFINKQRKQGVWHGFSCANDKKLKSVIRLCLICCFSVTVVAGV